MSLLVSFAMFGVIPLALALFATLPGRQAVVITVLFAWMVLPVVSYEISGLPDYTKITAMSVALILAMLAFDPGRILSFRPRWFDLPMIVWCLVPLASSLDNGLGAYDGLSAVLEHTLTWGLPYAVGRAYLGDLAGLRHLGLALIVAALAYSPLCLIEMRISPKLHTLVYGVTPRVNWERFEAFGPLQWKPVVFMEMAFSVTMLVGMGALVAFWMWWTGAKRYLGSLPMGWVALFLTTITVLCKVWSGNALTFLGMAVLPLTLRLRTQVFVVCLLVAPPLYIATRSSGKWSGESFHAAVSDVSEARGSSLKTRLDNEDILVAKALERPAFGWGRWGRNRVLDEAGKDVSITDGRWVLAIGQTGAVGLVALTLFLLLPLALFVKRYPPRMWSHGLIAPAAVVALMPALHMIDNLFNDFPNPIYFLAVGGVLSLRAPPGSALPRRQPPWPVMPPPALLPPPPGTPGPRRPAGPRGEIPRPSRPI